MSTPVLGCLRTTILVLGFALAIGFSATVAHATPITFYFSGRFEVVSGGAPGSLQDTEFGGSFSYDTASVPSSSNANTHVYPNAGSIAVETVLGDLSPTTLTFVEQSWNLAVGTSFSGPIDPADLLVARRAGVTFAGPLAVFNGVSLWLTDGTAAPADDPFDANLSSCQRRSRLRNLTRQNSSSRLIPLPSPQDALPVSARIPNPAAQQPQCPNRPRSRCSASAWLALPEVGGGSANCSRCTSTRIERGPLRRRPLLRADSLLPRFTTGTAMKLIRADATLQ